MIGTPRLDHARERNLFSTRIEAAEVADAHETIISLQLSIEQVMNLAAGFVPLAVKANCMGCLELLDGSEDERRAARPVPKNRKKSA